MACKNEPDLMERIKKAMRACKDHWMETNESNQFRVAVAAAILESSGAERDRLERSAESLQRANALIQALTAGVPIDVEKLKKDTDDIIPLMKIWREMH